MDVAGYGTLWRVPWVPELFSAPVLQQVLDRRRRDQLVAVPFFDGLVAGEPDALVESFAGEPELYDPVRGRVKGVQAFRAFVAHMSAWLAQRNVSVEDVGHVVLQDLSGANLPLTAVGVLDAANDSRLEVLPFLGKLLDAFEIGPLGIRQSLRIARLTR